MSDKAADKKPDAAPQAGAGEKKEGAAKGGGLMGKTPVLLGVVMVVEAVILFAGFKMLGGGPKSSEGATLATSEAAHGTEPGTAAGDRRKNVEINVVDLKAPNKRSGRTFLYDVSIFLVTRAEHQAAVTEAIKSSEALIRDRVRTIIAQSDPEKLGGGSEPGLETLRRQVKYQLDEILGEGLIEEVLVPRCIPFRADF